MKKLLLILVAMIYFTSHSYAKVYTLEAQSDPIEIESTTEKAEKDAFTNAQQKIAERVGVVIESFEKSKDLAYDKGFVIMTTASVQKILDKRFIYQNNTVTCYIKAEVDDEQLEKALDKAKVTAEKEYYHEMSNINEKEKDIYKAQSVNPTSSKDTDYINLLKQAKQSFLQKKYSYCIQYAQQAANCTTNLSDKYYHTTALAYLALANAKIGNFIEANNFADRTLAFNPQNFYALHAKQLNFLYQGNPYLSADYGIQILNCWNGQNVKYPLAGMQEVHFYIVKAYTDAKDFNRANSASIFDNFSVNDREKNISISVAMNQLKQAKLKNQLDNYFTILYFRMCYFANQGQKDIDTCRRLRNQGFPSFYNQALVYYCQAVSSENDKQTLERFQMAYGIAKQYPEEYEYKLLCTNILNTLKSQYVSKYPDCIKYVTGGTSL